MGSHVIGFAGRSSALVCLLHGWSHDCSSQASRFYVVVQSARASHHLTICLRCYRGAGGHILQITHSTPPQPNPTQPNLPLLPRITPDLRAYALPGKKDFRRAGWHGHDGQHFGGSRKRQRRVSVGRRQQLPLPRLQAHDVRGWRSYPGPRVLEVGLDHPGGGTTAFVSLHPRRFLPSASFYFARMANERRSVACTVVMHRSIGCRVMTHRCR